MPSVTVLEGKLTDEVTVELDILTHRVRLFKHGGLRLRVNDSDDDMMMSFAFIWILRCSLFQLISPIWITWTS